MLFLQGHNPNNEKIIYPIYTKYLEGKKTAFTAGKPYYAFKTTCGYVIKGDNKKRQILVVGEFTEL